MACIALEELPVGKYGKAGGTGALVARRNRRRIEALAQNTARGARFLDLGDHRGFFCAQRADEIARRPGSSREGFNCSKRRALLRGGDFAALYLEDALEDRHFAAFWVKATNSSIFCFAAPLLIAWLARSMPAFRLGATPAT